jgi:hypothetical protein
MDERTTSPISTKAAATSPTAAAGGMGNLQAGRYIWHVNSVPGNSSINTLVSLYVEQSRKPFSSSETPRDFLKIKHINHSNEE